MIEPVFEDYNPQDIETYEPLISDRMKPAQSNDSEPAFLRSDAEFDAAMDKLLSSFGEYDTTDFLAPMKKNAPAEQAKLIADENTLYDNVFAALSTLSAAQQSETSEVADEEISVDDHELTDDDSDVRHVILDMTEEPEEVEELESTFIRRVARKNAAQNEASEDDTSGLNEYYNNTLSRSEQDETPKLKERLLAPLVRYLALRQTRQRLREQEAATWPAPLNIRQTAELSPLKASRYYHSQLKPIKLRLTVLCALTVVMLWLGFSLPLPGTIGHNLRMQSAVSLVFLLAAMVCALDVVTLGFRQLFNLQPSVEALSALACLISCIDAALCAFGVTDNLPFCANAALSVLAALWAEMLRCHADSLNFDAAVPSTDSTVLGSIKDASGINFLLRFDNPGTGTVRRSEEPDGCQNAYAAAAPVFLILSLLLALLSTIGHEWKNILHNFASYLALCANCAGFLCFVLPWFISTVKLHKLGAAISGWQGCVDIGKSHRVIITDGDIFPAGTVKLDGINIVEGANVEKVVSYTYSVLTQSGSSIAAALAPLMQYRKYSMLTVEDFKCNDGGGLSAYIHGENVMLGSSGFLRLNSIRIPPDLTTDNAICIAINNELMGVFNMQYVPVKGVQYALRLLLRGHTQPIFAIRDFSITPLMIQRLFQLNTINFEFPSFKERYRLSSLSAKHDTIPAATLNRAGLRCAVETAELGRKLYISCIVNTALNLFSCALGLLLVFFSIKNGNSQAISVGRLLFYNILWALPCFATAYWVAK